MALIPPPHAMSAPVTPDGAVYVRAVLDAYRSTLGTTGRIRPLDRRLARDLHIRGVPLQSVIDALLLATARRYVSAMPGSQPATVRSLAYFAPIIDEVISEPMPAGYRVYLSGKLDRCIPVPGIIR